MPLTEKHNVHNRKRAKRSVILIVVCFLAIFFLMLRYSFASYVIGWEGHHGGAVAQWTIRINGVPLSDNLVSDEFCVELIPDTDIIPEFPQKIKAGQTGHFDVEIDPAGTETAIEYAVVVDIVNSKMPGGMSVDGYCFIYDDPAEPVKIVFSEDDRSVEGVVELPESGIFTDNDRITIRFYWIWADDATDSDFDEFGDYRITVTVTVMQYSSKEADSGNAEGASAL